MEDLRQRFVAVLVGVDIGVAAFVGVLLKQSAAVPDEVGAFRVGTRPGEFVLAFFGKASAERVVGVCPDLGIAGWLFDFGADQLVFEVVLEVLVFAVRELAVDQVAQGVVGVVTNCRMTKVVWKLIFRQPYDFIGFCLSQLAHWI